MPSQILYSRVRRGDRGTAPAYAPDRTAFQQSLAEHLDSLASLHSLVKTMDWTVRKTYTNQPEQIISMLPLVRAICYESIRSVNGCSFFLEHIIPSNCHNAAVLVFFLYVNTNRSGESVSHWTIDHALFLSTKMSFAMKEKE